MNTPYKKLFEFTLDDWRNQISNIIKRTRAERNSVKGKEVKIARFIDVEFQRNSPILLFATEPTYSFDAPTMQGPRRKSHDNLYDIKVQLMDFGKWKKGTKWADLSLQEFKEILDVIDLKMNCTCMHFHFGGIRYELSQMNSAIQPTTIPDPVWFPRHGRVTLCKHLAGILKIIKFHSPTILKQLKSYAVKQGVS